MRRAALVLAATAAFLFSGVSIAATKVPVSMPSARMVANGGGQAVKNGDRLHVPGDGKTEYIKATSSGTKGTPVRVTPSVDYSIPRTINKAKAAVRGGFVWAFATAGVLWAIDQIPDADWDGYQLTREKHDSTGLDLTKNYYWPVGPDKFATFHAAFDKMCSNMVTPTVYTSCEITGYTYPLNGNPAAAKADYRAFYKPAGVYQQGSFQLNRQGSGCTAPAVLDTATGSCGVKVKAPFAETDYAMLDAALNQVSNSDWLKEILKASCENSLNPAACFDELVEDSALEGPASVVGPSSTTQTTSPAGVTTVNSQTNYSLLYGDNYFTWNAVTTTTKTNPDGSTETTTETGSEEVTEEQPQEETEEEAIEAPALSDPYKPVVDKYKDIGQEVKDVQGLAPGINYAPWYSFGGACHEIEVELPIVGMWRTAYCPYIENMVRPVLAFLFILFTWHRCYSMWQEAVRVGRPI